MNINLTEEEIKPVSYLSYLALLEAVLVNDYFSYEKEKQALPPGSDLGVTCNAVTVLAREHSITVDGAKQVLAEKILAAEEEFRQLKRTFDASQPPISKELQRYLSGIEMMVSGFFLWHSSSPRYHNLHPSPATCPVDFTSPTANESGKKDLKITKETGQEDGSKEISQENGSIMQNIYQGVSVINLDDEVLYKF